MCLVETNIGYNTKSAYSRMKKISNADGSILEYRGIEAIFDSF